MIKLNLLKEGHGILYKEKKTSLYIKFIRVSVVIFFLTGIIFFVMREELYTTWYIVSDEEGGIDLENFFKSEQDEDLEIQEILKRPIEEKRVIAEDKKQGVEEKTADVEDKKVAVEEIVKSEEKKSEEPKLPLKAEQAAVVSPPVKEDKEVQIKEADVPDQIIGELSYRVVAGACLLRESADTIIENLKKSGYEDAYIKTATMPIDMYYLYLGEFKTTDEIELIKERNKSIDFNIKNKDGRYILNTESVNSIKAAERLKRAFEKDGIAADILKHKERKDVFVVVVKNFNDYKEATTFNNELRDKGFASVVASQ